MVRSARTGQRERRQALKDLRARASLCACLLAPRGRAGARPVMFGVTTKTIAATDLHCATGFWSSRTPPGTPVTSHMLLTTTAQLPPTALHAHYEQATRGACTRVARARRRASSRTERKRCSKASLNLSTIGSGAVASLDVASVSGAATPCRTALGIPTFPVLRCASPPLWPSIFFSAAASAAAAAQRRRCGALLGKFCDHVQHRRGQRIYPLADHRLVSAYAPFACCSHPGVGATSGGRFRAGRGMDALNW